MLVKGKRPTGQGERCRDRTVQFRGHQQGIGTETAQLATTRPYVSYVDFIGPGASHTACDPGNNWVTGFVPVDGIVPLHPTAQGEAAFARLVLAALGKG